MTEFRQIKENDAAAFLSLIDAIEKALPDKAWWLPINPTVKEHFFDESWCYLLGAYDGERLIGASCLFFNETEYGETARLCGLPLNDTAEIGRCMVLPEYRGNNLLFLLNQELLSVAKKRSIRHIIITIHPQNIPSLSSFRKLGARYRDTIVKYDRFPREVYTMDI